MDGKRGTRKSLKEHVGSLRISQPLGVQSDVQVIAIASRVLCHPNDVSSVSAAVVTTSRYNAFYLFGLCLHRFS